ncbi:uncharacterized protein DUF3301 [Azonexus fungiphilus]|uniref:Uncharacterized protein DUF3301 n=1 Tax=Azonexus fungiphilus TaxID=146940 RepID=A0A495WLJ1_9RHOO|nr:DUF3301 domain-containing protein [Azonexus fungiphilus]NHC05666.1 DUF3301 domain-containing protein [Azonexus fungiphilus]RKT60738.1 uncharacterized protein DUF3301 [Azonexus fungiphilus]
MPIYESIFILAAAAGVWFWLDSLKAREVAIAAARAACAEEGLQFLDDTAIGNIAGLARDDAGRLRLRRRLRFEYSDTGDNRRNGSVVLLGHAVEYLHLRPQLYVVPKTHETRH